jgi:hypothetical protein
MGMLVGVRLSVGSLFGVWLCFPVTNVLEGMVNLETKGLYQELKERPDHTLHEQNFAKHCSCFLAGVLEPVTWPRCLKLFYIKQCWAAASGVRGLCYSHGRPSPVSHLHRFSCWMTGEESGSYQFCKAEHLKRVDQEYETNENRMVQILLPWLILSRVSEETWRFQESPQFVGRMKRFQKRIRVGSLGLWTCQRLETEKQMAEIWSVEEHFKTKDFCQRFLNIHSP